MINNLLVLQFPFIYLPMLIIGLSSFDYNSDFDSPSSFIYFAGLLYFVLPWILRRLLSNPVHQFNTMRVLLALQVACGFMLYYPMLLGYWDERSSLQAVLLVVLGFCSLSVAWIARHSTSINSPVNIIAALIVVLTWLINTEYVMVAFLVLSLIAIAGFFLYEAPENLVQSARLPVSLGLPLALAAANWTYIFVDYHIDPRFSSSAALLMVGLFAGAVIASQRRIPIVVFSLLGLGNFAVALLLEPWLLNSIHAIVLGAWIGGLFCTYYQAGRLGQFSAYLFLGCFLGVIFYKNLAFAAYIGVLFVPAILMIYLQHRRLQPVSQSPEID